MMEQFPIHDSLMTVPVFFPTLEEENKAKDLIRRMNILDEAKLYRVGFDLVLENLDLLLRTVASYILRNRRGETVVDGIVLYEKEFTDEEGLLKKRISYYCPGYSSEMSNNFELDLCYLLGCSEEEIQYQADMMGW